MQAKRVIIMGASAGGIDALQTVVGHLPAELPAAILVVLHLAADSPGYMPTILAHAGPLAAAHAVDGEWPQVGRIYVAPPDQHLLVEPSGRLRLSRGPKENLFRPAIDPLFRSAAHAHGAQVIGVVLSGALDDGAAGLWAVMRHGGVTIVQDPTDALIPSMPESALRYVSVDHCAPAAEIGPLLARLAASPVPTPKPAEEAPLDLETRVLLGELPSSEGGEASAFGTPSRYACPECHGTLQEIREGSYSRYRCHLGHAYSVDNLLSKLTLEASDALWNALRAVEESATLLRQEAAGAHDDGDERLRDLYLHKARQANMNADAIRAVVLRQERLSRAAVKAAP